MSFHTDPMQMAEAISRIKGISIGKALEFLGGVPTQAGVMAETGKTLNALTFGQMPKTVGRFAGSKLGRGLARAVPGLSVAGNVMDVADILTGDESLGNKAMDTAAMAAGGTIGGLMGVGVFSPLTASIGASVGKMGSDSLQWLFGDKKTPEQRKLEEALALLQGGMI